MPNQQVQEVLDAADQIRRTWAAEGATREGLLREFAELLGVDPDDDDDVDSDLDTVPAPTDPMPTDTGNPVGRHTSADFARYYPAGLEN